MFLEDWGIQLNKIGYNKHMDTLVDKTLRVIESCKTLKQLEAAKRFYWLALRNVRPLYILHFSEAYDDKLNELVNKGRLNEI